MGSRFLPPLAAFLFLGLSLAPVMSVRAQAQAPLYLALGDSLAFGVGADSPATQGYVGLTQDALNAQPKFAGSGLDLLNLSAPGATSADLLQPDGQLDRALSEIDARSRDRSAANDVQIISLNIGGNDLLALAERDAPCLADAAGKPCQDELSTMLGNLNANVAELLGRLREAAPEAEIYVMNLYNPYSGSGDPLEIVASIGVQQVNGVIGAVAARPDFGARLVHVYDLFQGRARQWIASDHIHPNNNGYRVMAEALEAAIARRPVLVPADLLSPPTDPPLDVPVIVQKGDGVDTVLVLIALPAVFIAGAMLSAAYFLVRGRR